MRGSSLARPPLAPVSGERDDRAIAGRLAREFSAPVGLLDPTTLAWRARVGAEDDDFPEADAALSAALAGSVLWNGRAAVWRPGRDRGPTWLCLPAPRPDGGDLLALVGFASLARDGWGPACPDRALVAWGQSVADALRGDAFPRSAPTFRGEGGDRLHTARLIRRMRISDAPETFQAIALKALRAAIDVAAVAWVPGPSGEPVVVSGAVEGLRPGDFRALVPVDTESTVSIVNGGPRTILPCVRRAVVVAASSGAAAGWLVAVNPLDDRPFGSGEVQTLQPVASLIVTHRVNARLYRDLKEMLFGIIRALTAAIDAKDPYTSGHSERVARIAVRIAEELGISSEQRIDLYLMGLLHDVGKIGVDDGVLKKPGPLTPDEYKSIQSHVSIGMTILSDLKKLRHLMPGVASHHENFDGSGYPQQLRGDSIPLVARILAVADAFDAMSSTRPYRKSMTPMKIDEIFRSGAGKQWDPSIVAALFSARADVEKIRQKGIGDSLVAAVDKVVDKDK